MLETHDTSDPLAVIGRYVYHTDYGANWTPLGPTPVGGDTRTEKPRVAEGYPPAVSFLNERSIVLARKDGDVYRSDNGGAKWERVWSVNNYLINVYFFNDKAGWISAPTASSVAPRMAAHHGNRSKYQPVHTSTMSSS